MPAQKLTASFRNQFKPRAASTPAKEFSVKVPSSLLNCACSVAPRILSISAPQNPAIVTAATVRRLLWGDVRMPSADAISKAPQNAAAVPAAEIPPDCPFLIGLPLTIDRVAPRTAEPISVAQVSAFASARPAPKTAIQLC